MAREWTRADDHRESVRIERERAAHPPRHPHRGPEGWTDDPGPEPIELTGTHHQRAAVDLERTDPPRDTRRAVDA